MPRIFICYSRVDEQATETVLTLLREHYGWDNVWNDTRIVGSMDWWQEILRQIKNCDVFVYLLSNESVESDYCHAEFTEAQRLGRPVVTVQVRGRTRIPPELSRIQYVDMAQDGVINAFTLNKLYKAIDYTADQPRQRRANWRPATVCPHVLTPEEENVQAEDKSEETLILPVARPHFPASQKSRRIIPVQATIWAAGIGGIFVLLVAGIIILPDILRGKEMTPTLTPTLSPIKLAAISVENNDDWLPYSNEIGGTEMVLVPNGCFMMGNDNGNSNEIPAKEYCFTEPFWIDRTEVTRGMYQKCIDAGECETPPNSDSSSEDNQPITRVTWLQAKQYCEFREARLPTEAEWEYAARGPDILMYPWGNEFVADSVVYEESPEYGEVKTAPVGSKSAGASWVGALDMSGNVWEWTSTIYDQDNYPYPYDASDGREDIGDTNINRVLRGGSFSNSSVVVTTVYRAWGDPVSMGNDFGFRCVLSL